MMSRSGSWTGNKNTIVDTLSVMQGTTGAAGQLFYNTTYNALFGWTVDRWFPVSIDPRYGFFMASEEFTGSDRIGTLDWSNSGTQNIIAGNLLNPGIYQVSASASSSQSRLNGQLNAFQLGTMDLYMETTLAIPTLSNGTDNANYAWLLNDGSSFDTNSAATDGAYIIVGSSNILSTVTASNGSLTTKPAGFAPSAGTYYTYGLYVNASNTANFTVNGSSLTVAHATNLPTGAGRQTGINYRIDKNLGAGALTMNFDNFVCYGFFNQRRD